MNTSSRENKRKLNNQIQKDVARNFSPRVASFFSRENKIATILQSARLESEREQYRRFREQSYSCTFSPYCGTPLRSAIDWERSQRTYEESHAAEYCYSEDDRTKLAAASRRTSIWGPSEPRRRPPPAFMVGRV